MKSTSNSLQHVACCLLFGAALTSVSMASLGQQPSASEAGKPASASAGSWVATGNLNVARTGHTATLLADGKVLVVGGWADTYIADAELYDPTTGVWTLTGITKCTRQDGFTYTATLLSDGKTIGRHYAGPNWEHADGSAVVGKAAGSVPGATSNDIPWLKLDVISRRGSGVLTGVTTVQRINTRGGMLAGACDKPGTFSSVPYSADYVFLRKG